FYSVAGGPEGGDLGQILITDQPTLHRIYHLPAFRRTQFSGEVRKPDGSPASGTLIRLIPLDPKSPGFVRARTDAQGKFRFEREPAQGVIYAVDPVAGLAAIERIESNDRTKPLDLRPAGDARLRLVDSQNKPSANAPVFVFVRSRDWKGDQMNSVNTV